MQFLRRLSVSYRRPRNIERPLAFLRGVKSLVIGGLGGFTPFLVLSLAAADVNTFYEELQRNPEVLYDKFSPGKLLLGDSSNSRTIEDRVYDMLYEHENQPPKGTPLTIEDCNKPFHEVMMKDLLDRLPEDVDKRVLKTQNALEWIDYFKSRNYDFGTVYAWASRYAARSTSRTPLNTQNLHEAIRQSKRLNFDKLCQSTFQALSNPVSETLSNPLRSSNPSDYHWSLCHIKEGVEPYARYISSGGCADNRQLSNPLRMFPRRIWDLHSNRVIPFDWLVTSDANNMTYDPVQTYANILRSFVKIACAIGILPASSLSSDRPAWLWRVDLINDPFMTMGPGGLCIAPFAALSHSWTTDMTPVWTEINRFQWPVPVPAGVSLEDVRQELLSMGIRYCWVDILCLRQKYDEERGDKKQLQKKFAAWGWRTIWGPYFTHTVSQQPMRQQDSIRPVGEQVCMLKHAQTPTLRLLEDHLEKLKRAEEIRKTEWEIDVATIGNIYHRASSLVIYLNGLGKPADLTPEAHKSSQHWFNRAWTLQELGGHSPVDKKCYVGGLKKPGGEMLEKQILDIRSRICSDDFNFVPEIVRRKSTNPVDKIAGLTYVVLTSNRAKIPAYAENRSMQEAWQLFVQILRPTGTYLQSLHSKAGAIGKQETSWLTTLLLKFPHPSGRHWYPSWDQVSAFPNISKTEQPEPREHSWSLKVDPNVLALGTLAHNWGIIKVFRKCKITQKTSTNENRWEYKVEPSGLRDPGDAVTLWVDKKEFLEPISDGEYSAVVFLNSRGNGGLQEGSSWVVLCKKTGWWSGFFKRPRRYLRKLAVLRLDVATKHGVDEASYFSGGYTIKPSLPILHLQVYIE